MVAMIGSGNVAYHLSRALNGKTEVRMVNPRTLEGLPGKPDIILIAVTDTAIREVAEKLKGTEALVAHTSGSIGLEALNGISSHIGVFYPLQTFTKGIDPDYSEIPILIEGSDPETSEKLKSLAHLFTARIEDADSEKRRKLHLAAVFACNFTNALAGISRDILAESGIDFSLLLPLMKQTVKKLEILTPKEAQTGPAVRGDRQVIESHLAMLESKPEAKEIYAKISHLISSKSSKP